MTVRDRKAIKELFFIDRYLVSSIARLFGLSEPRILAILKEQGDVTFTSSTGCQLCSSEEAQPFFIDGDENNNRPQNKIMLCDPDKRRIQHLQLRRKTNIVVVREEVLTAPL